MTNHVDNTATSIALGVGAITSLAEDADTSARTKIADLVFTDEDGGSPGTPKVVGINADMFEVDGNVLYLKAGAILDHEAADTLNVSVQLTEDSTVSVDVSVAINDVDDAPTITTSFIAVNPGDTGSITLTDENINFTDSDVPEDPANIIYTIRQAATGASLTRGGVALSAGDTFTHQDILDGWVALTVSDENALSGLRLTIADSADANLVQASLDIQVRDVVSIATPDDAANNVDYSEDTRNLVIDTGDYRDQITGSQGSDFITGGLADDTINLDSGDGNGSGQDTVVYNFGSGSIPTAIDGGDVITGFRRGEDIFLLKTESDNPELATLDGLLSYASGSDRESSHDDFIAVSPNFVFGPEDGGSNIVVTGITGITFHFHDAGIYGNGYLASGFVSITFDEQLDWADFLSLIEIDNGNGTVDENFNYSRGLIRDVSALPNLMGEGSLAYERQGAVLPIEIAPSGVKSVEETPGTLTTQGRTEVTYFVLTGVATGDLRLARVGSTNPADPNDFFEIDGNVLYLKSGKSLDYDSGVRILNVRVQDVNDSAVGVDVKVKVENVNDVAPVFVLGTTGAPLPANHVVEFGPATTVVYDAAATFDRTRIVWSLKQGQEDDYALFDIDVDTGEITFKPESRPDFDNVTAYSFTVVATSGALITEQQVAIYPTGYVMPVIADTTGSIRDGDARTNNGFLPLSGDFMVTSGSVDSWMAVRVPADTNNPEADNYGTLSFTDDNGWEFALTETGTNVINGLDADNPLAVVTFDVTATNVLGSDTARLTINLQGFSPRCTPLVQVNDFLYVKIAVDSESSGQIGFIGDEDGTAFATNLITPIGRHSSESAYHAAASGSTEIEGKYGTLTLNHDGSWVYVLRYDDPDTIAESKSDPRFSGRETFWIGYRSGNDGDAMIHGITITVANTGAPQISNDLIQFKSYSFLPASGRIEVERGDYALDSAYLEYGIGATRAKAMINLNERIGQGTNAPQEIEIPLLLGLDQETQIESAADPYGLFHFDPSDGSWTYTLTEDQAGRDANDRINGSDDEHNNGDIASVTAYIAAQDITGAMIESTLDLLVSGADVVEVIAGGPYVPGSHRNEFLKGRFGEVNGVEVFDRINTGGGNNGIAGLGGDDFITLGGGRFESSTRVDEQIDVVYHRVQFNPDTYGRWDNTRNVDGNDTINNFIRNEDQFIFIEWTRPGDGVKISEEDFLTNPNQAFLEPIIEQSGTVFTLAGVKIVLTGLTVPNPDDIFSQFITINYHTDHQIQLTNADGSLTTNIFEQYGIASTTDNLGRHSIISDQLVRGSVEVQHSYFGDTNEDSFQVLDARPEALLDLI